MPMVLSLEPTTSCNLRCPECLSGLRGFSRPTGMIELDMVEKIMAQTPMNRFGDPHELVGAALLLCSRQAGSFITGAEFYVDGGFTGNRF